MDDMLLTEYGIDRAKGLKNCMDNLPFYKKILSMFLCDDCFQRTRAAHEAKDYKALFSCAHELKGVSGNAALTALYKATVPLVELLRGGVCADEEAEARLFAGVDAAYELARQGIALILSE